MTLPQRTRLLAIFARLSFPRWTGSVEPKLSGPFSFAGREYMREPLECWADDSVT